MGHPLYEESKRLKAENEALRAQLREGRAVPDTDIVLEGVKGFFQGTARVMVERNGDDYSIRFQM